MASLELIKKTDGGEVDVESTQEKVLIPTERTQWARKSEFMLACIGYAVCSLYWFKWVFSIC